MSEHGEKSGDPQVLAPALTAEEWERGAYSVEGGECVDNDNGIFTVEAHEREADGNYRLTDRVDVERVDKLLAMCNHALPDDHPLKLTHADVAMLRLQAERQHPASIHAFALEQIAAKLAALLPPPDVAG